jgi:hypothetical protein
MTSRKLTLRREALAELSTADLRAVAGGAPTNGGICETLIPTCTTTGYYPSIFDPC